MPRASRKPPTPRPQTQRCRFVDDRYGRCRSIATVDGFCHACACELEEEMEHRHPLETIFESLGGWFAGRNQRTARMAQNPDLQTVIEEGLGMAARHLRARAQAAQVPAEPGQARQAPPPRQAPPRGRVSPEAIAARKQNIAARGILGFDPDETLTEDAIKAKRRELARVWHTDNTQSKDPTREAMMRKINAAADLLTAAARGR